eukprot:4938828-Pyramimonas_sp.AAC.1
MAALAYGSPTQGRVSRLDRELHRRPRWLHSHAVPPPKTALRGPVWSSIEDEIFTIAEPISRHICEESLPRERGPDVLPRRILVAG